VYLRLTLNARAQPDPGETLAFSPPLTDGPVHGERFHSLDFAYYLEGQKPLLCRDCITPELSGAALAASE